MNQLIENEIESTPTIVTQNFVIDEEDGVVSVDQTIATKTMSLANFPNTTFPAAERYFPLRRQGWQSTFGQDFSFNISTTYQSILCVPWFTVTGGFAGEWIDTTYAHPWITLAMYYYKYVRWRSMTFMIELESQPLQYGFLAAVVLPTYSPYMNATSTFSSSSPFDRTSVENYNPTLMEIGTTKMIEVEVPFMSMYQWCTTNEFNEDEPVLDPSNCIAHMPSLYLYTQTNLYTVSTATTSHITGRVFCKFNGLEFDCPCIVSTAFAQKRRRVAEGNCCMERLGQAMVNNPSDTLAVGMGVAAVSALALAGSAFAIGVMPHVEKRYSGAYKMANSNPSIAIKNMSGSRNQTNVASGISDYSVSNQEEFKKTQQQAVVNPFVPDFALGGTGTTCHALASGVDIPVDPREYGDQGPHSIVELCKVPSYFMNTLLSASATERRWHVYFNLPHTSTYDGSPIFNQTYFSYMCQFFRQWRGSYRFSCVFTSCSLIMARIRIAWGWLQQGDSFIAGTVNSLRALNNIEDIVVKGMTTFNFKIPFIYPNDWAPTFLETNNTLPATYSPVVIIKLLSIQSYGDVTPVVPLLVYTSMDDDLEFRFPMHISGPPAVVEGNACSYRPWEEFQSGQFKVPIGITPRTYTRKQEAPIILLEELITRWSSYLHGGGSTGTAILLPGAPRLAAYSGTTADAQSTVFQMVSSLFYWMSGDVDFFVSVRKLESSTAPQLGQGDQLVSGWGTRTNSVSEVGAIDPGLPDTGISYMDIDKWTNLRVTVPMIADFAAKPTDWWMAWQQYDKFITGGSPSLISVLDQQQFICSIQTFTPSAIRSTIDRVYWRAGRSFQLMGLMPIPAYGYWPINTIYVPSTTEALLMRAAKSSLSLSLRGPHIRENPNDPPAPPSFRSRTSIEQDIEVRSREGKEKDKSKMIDKALQEIRSRHPKQFENRAFHTLVTEEMSGFLPEDLQ